jgi:hypothetical protein
MAQARGEQCRAVELTPPAEATSHAEQLANELALDPVTTMIQGSSATFGYVFALQASSGEPSGGFLYLCEGGVFHFLPIESLRKASPWALLDMFRAGAYAELSREAKERSAMQLWNMRFLLFIGAMYCFLLGYLFGSGFE